MSRFAFPLPEVTITVLAGAVSAGTQYGAVQGTRAFSRIVIAQGSAARRSDRAWNPVRIRIAGGGIRSQKLAVEPRRQGSNVREVALTELE